MSAEAKDIKSKDIDAVREAVADDRKVGLFALTPLIVGGTIGSGIFALPATITRGAGTLGILVGWMIITFGMLALV